MQAQGISRIDGGGCCLWDIGDALVVGPLGRQQGRAKL
jgi:hypothetical protein